uniref:tumor necrosis factor receptor superfamily member 11A n=1 Tax=Semicossyphus pulcher TaxID=241346 RepID=UPI0037E9C105
MRFNGATRWILRGWITCVLVSFYAQNVVAKSVKCDETQYLKGSRCCNKCKPGHSVYSDCTDSQETKCRRCNPGEYQPGWTEEMNCVPQKICDLGKGFMTRPENFVAQEPCRCSPGRQCFPINCEYCEKIPTCAPGFGLEVDPESTLGRKICVKCKGGFFTAGNSGEQCKPWTICKAQGRREIQPGSAQADAVCGPHISAAALSWVIVSVLSVITVLCLLILLLFCYKDKLKLLSVNLRSCVQNLKRTRIQQETLAPLYHSGAGGGIGGGPGGPKCNPCEMTKLICQAPQSPTDGPLCNFPTTVPEVKVSLPPTEEEGKGKTVMKDHSEGSGEPEEVSEEEEVVSVSPLLAGSCVCVVPIREPLEVGENEDCSQAVSSGIPGTCSCGGLDGERDEDESRKEEIADSGGKRMVSSKSDTGVASLVSLSPPLVHTSSVISPSSPLPELCLPLTQAQVRPEFKPHLTDMSLLKQEEFYRLTSTDSTSTENSTTSAMTSVSPLMTSSSVGDLYLDKPPEASSQGLSLGDSRGNKLFSVESGLDCSPESLHSQLAEPTLTSGQVSGNHNTTFISSGQVMNFSGEVIVVYVSQTSLGSDGVEQDDAFGSPVQEEANVTAPFFQSSLRSQGDSYSQRTLQEETLPVQEAMVERHLGK